MLAALLAVLVAAGKVKSAAAVHKPKRHPVHAADPFGRRAVVIARRLLGRPYRWGGTSPAAGFDCSGLVYFVYSRLGIQLPRSSFGQMEVGRAVRRAGLKPGDLLFFDGSSHVGLYLGHGRFIHAPHTGARVTVANLGDPWFSRGYESARRVIQESAVVSGA